MRIVKEGEKQTPGPASYQNELNLGAFDESIKKLKKAQMIELYKNHLGSQFTAPAFGAVTERDEGYFEPRSGPSMGEYDPKNIKPYEAENKEPSPDLNDKEGL